MNNSDREEITREVMWKFINEMPTSRRHGPDFSLTFSAKRDQIEYLIYVAMRKMEQNKEGLWAKK